MNTGIIVYLLARLVRRCQRFFCNAEQHAWGPTPGREYNSYHRTCHYCGRHQLLMYDGRDFHWDGMTRRTELWLEQCAKKASP